MKKAIISSMVYFMLVSINLYSQVEGFRNDNILLPNQLLFSDYIGFNDVYKHSYDSTNQGPPVKPFFDITIHGDYINALVNMVLEGKITVFDPNEIESQFPYGNLKLSPLTINEVKTRLGYRVDSVMQMNDDGTTQISLTVTEPKIDDILSINFIDEWVLTVNPFQFMKKVIALEPIKRYDNDFGEGYRNMKAFRFCSNPSEQPSAKNLKPLATVKYEYFFDIDNAFRTDDFLTMIGFYMKHCEEGYPTNQYPSNVTSPFFNAINQNIFIETLISNVTKGSIPVEDYNSKKKLSTDEVKGQITEKHKVLIQNLDGNLEEREVENDFVSQIRSVIFSEEWFFDEETMAIQKKVVGIAPVRYFNEWIGDQSKVKRQILFNIILN